MLVSKSVSFRSLLESNEGLHLTCYLKNSDNLLKLKRQLRENIEIAHEYLAPIMSFEEACQFLQPLQALIDDTQVLKKMKGNIGLFRTPQSFRILNLPIDVDQLCVVATSFHVKPLLRWMQMDRDFLILGFEAGSASLYHANQNSIHLVDTILFSETLRRMSEAPEDYSDFKQQRLKKMKMDEAFVWLNTWLGKMTKEVQPRIYVAGAREITSKFLDQSKYPNLIQRPVWPSFSASKVDSICHEIRQILKKESQAALDLALLEFYQAEDQNLAKKNIFHIAKAATQGKIRKLIVADGIHIFGKLDRKTGGLAIHPAALDHEDDDLLDDLAQTVLAQGGEVIIAPRDHIPNGRPILAIVDDPSKKSENKQDQALLQFWEK